MGKLSLDFISSVFGSAGNIGLGLYNQSQQKAENDKNRKFNAEQAQLNRDFQERMFHESNAYNTPAQQVLRMKSAGLNPALMYQGSGFGAPAAAPSGSSASASGSALPSVSGDLNIARQLAEIENIKANTKKTDEEAKGQATDNKWKDLMNESIVSSNNMTVTVGDSVRKMNEAQFATLTKNLRTIELQWEEISERVNLLRSQVTGQNLDNVLKDIEKRFKAPYMEAIIGKISAETAMSKFQVFRGMKLLTLEALNLQNDASLKASQSSLNHFLGVKQYQENSAFSDLYQEQIRGIKIQNNQLEFNLENDKTFRSAERSAGIFHDIMVGLGSVLNGLSSASSSGLFKGKSRPIGFGK